MASNETVLVKNGFSELYYLQFISRGISTFLNEHFQLVQFYFLSNRVIKRKSKLKAYFIEYLFRKVVSRYRLDEFTEICYETLIKLRHLVNSVIMKKNLLSSSGCAQPIT